jgi:hypothetical protein
VALTVPPRTAAGPDVPRPRVLGPSRVATVAAQHGADPTTEEDPRWASRERSWSAWMVPSAPARRWSSRWRRPHAAVPGSGWCGRFRKRATGRLSAACLRRCSRTWPGGSRRTGSRPPRARGLGSAVLGSVGLQCVLHAPVPVTVVRPVQRSSEAPVGAEPVPGSRPVSRPCAPRTGPNAPAPGPTALPREPGRPDAGPSAT